MTKRGEARKRDEQKRQLDGMTPRTPPTTDAYRRGWDRIFAKAKRDSKRRAIRAHIDASVYDVWKASE